MGILLIAGLAKANDHFNRPWLFSGVYVAVMFFYTMLFPSTTKTFSSIFINLGFNFIVLGLLFSLLYRYQDSILAWVGILFVGLFVLSGGAKLMLGVWF